MHGQKVGKSMALLLDKPYKTELLLLNSSTMKTTLSDLTMLPEAKTTQTKCALERD